MRIRVIRAIRGNLPTSSDRFVPRILKPHASKERGANTAVHGVINADFGRRHQKTTANSRHGIALPQGEKGENVRAWSAVRRNVFNVFSDMPERNRDGAESRRVRVLERGWKPRLVRL